MRFIFWIAQRELLTYWHSASGIITMSMILLVDGLLFNAWAIGGTSRYSNEVLEVFFYCKSGTTLFTSVLLSMRLIAEERQLGTLDLFWASPVRDWQLVYGKFLAALIFLSGITLMTIYMPTLVLLHGQISLGHVATGYLGLLLLGSAALALGLVGSALAPNQLVAAILGAALVTIFLLMWLLSRIASPPIEDLLAYLSLHHKHFRPFMHGIISFADVLFYISLTYLALHLAIRILEARRWQQS